MVSFDKMHRINRLRKELFIERVKIKNPMLTSQSSWVDLLTQANLDITAFQDIDYDVLGNMRQLHMWPDTRQFLRSLHGCAPLMNELYDNADRDEPYHQRYGVNAEIYMTPRHKEMDTLQIWDIYLVSPLAAEAYDGDWLVFDAPIAMCISFVSKLPDYLG